jgi:DNA-directed RNA polymerase subunit RPC12/RpoP
LERVAGVLNDPARHEAKTPSLPSSEMMALTCLFCGEEFSDPHGTEIGGLAAFECPKCGEEAMLEESAF